MTVSSQRPLTHAVDRAANEIGACSDCMLIISILG
jgi:hypothetical protein